MMLACIGCEWRLRSDFMQSSDDSFIERYDKAESFFLTTGDYSALQQMQTRYPGETRRLIEDVLKLGTVADPYIKTRFYGYFQDSTLQMIIDEVARQYGDMSDLDEQLQSAFDRLQELLPGVEIPKVYTQITSLDQSIVVDSGQLAISLDKYLGADYPLYRKFGYSDFQLKMMNRENIVPDCISFYLLSLYQKPDTLDRDVHMGRIQHVVNSTLDRKVFEGEHVQKAEQLTVAGCSFAQLLENRQ